MRHTALILLAASSVVLSPGFLSLSHAHEEGDSRVAIQLENEAAMQAGPLALSFQLIDLEKKSTISDADLQEVHEKKLHFIVYDPALQEFRHEHPVFNGTIWTVSTSLSRNGSYWVWAQGELNEETKLFSAPTRMTVTGGLPVNSAPPQLGEARSGSDGISQVVAAGSLRAGKSSMLVLTFSRSDGSSIQLSPYLGQMAHLVVVPSDGDSLIHVHPMATSRPDELMLHLELPLSGEYRLWVQFKDGGMLKTIPLSLTVPSAEKSGTRNRP